MAGIQPSSDLKALLFKDASSNARSVKFSAVAKTTTFFASRFRLSLGWSRALEADDNLTSHKCRKWENILFSCEEEAWDTVQKIDKDLNALASNTAMLSSRNFRVNFWPWPLVLFGFMATRETIRAPYYPSGRRLTSGNGSGACRGRSCRSATPPSPFPFFLLHLPPPMESIFFSKI